MLELLHYLYFLIAIGGVNRLIDRIENVKEIFTGSIICNIVSIIWYPALYISMLYHLLLLLKFYNRRYQIDFRKYIWILDYIDHSNNLYIRMFQPYYINYFNRFEDRLRSYEGIRDMVSIEEYLNKLIGKLQLFILPITAYLVYTGLNLDIVYIFYWICILYRVAISGKKNAVRFLHYFYVILFVFFNSKLIIYPYLFSLSLVTNELFHFGLPDNLRELFGYKPTRYCKYCSEGLTNNLLEGVLIDHNLVRGRVHRDCYCRYVYQCQVRYVFDTIMAILISPYMIYWVEDNTRKWLLLILSITFYDKISYIIPKRFSIYSIYIMLIIQFFILGGMNSFVDPMFSYSIFIFILTNFMYKNISYMF